MKRDVKIYNRNCILSGPNQPIVFVGDSLTARCNLRKFYPKYLCENKGISGDTLRNFAKKRNPFDVAVYPKAIVFLMGINDVVFAGDRAATLKEVYRDVLGRFKSEFHAVPIIVQSLYPVSISFEEELRLPDGANAIIEEINGMLRELCDEMGLVYADVHSSLLKDGELNREYALDKIHVNERCYEVIAEKITAVLDGELKKNVLDIRFDGEYPANQLSNFYPHRFELDGVVCESMEGFLQSLKYRCRYKQAKICKLTGLEAKQAGSKKTRWKKTHKVYWKGKTYDRRCKDFRCLITEAYHALYENEEFAAALKSADGMRLEHSIGLDNKNETILTEDEFICQLRRLRWLRDKMQNR